MQDFVAEEALADWLDFVRDFEPVEGVDFDWDDTPRPTASVSDWGRPSEDDSPLPW